MKRGKLSIESAGVLKMTFRRDRRAIEMVLGAPDILTERQRRQSGGIQWRDSLRWGFSLSPLSNFRFFVIFILPQNPLSDLSIFTLSRPPLWPYTWAAHSSFPQRPFPWWSTPPRRAPCSPSPPRLSDQTWKPQALVCTLPSHGDGLSWTCIEWYLKTAAKLTHMLGKNLYISSSRTGQGAGTKVSLKSHFWLLEWVFGPRGGHLISLEANVAKIIAWLYANFVHLLTSLMAFMKV